MKTLFLDVETSGLPHWHLPSDDRSQPLVVELCARLLDDGELIDEIECYVSPFEIDPNFVMPQEVIDIHGITDQVLHDCGTLASSVVGDFLDIVAKADVIAAFNSRFDVRMMRILIARVTGDKWEPEIPIIDVQLEAARRTGILKKNARTSDDWKRPSLVEAHTALVGPIAAAHRASADVAAMIAVARALGIGGLSL